MKETNPLGAIVLHASAAWSARYWLEEEAHHEVAYGTLLEMAGIEPIPHEELVAHRGFFPEDNYARSCVLQACVEIEAVISYSHIAEETKDPLIRDIFWRVMRDEAQHRQYFISFAKALVDAGVSPIKDILSMAYTWIRPGVGETYGSKRNYQNKREGFVNWWDNVINDPAHPFILLNDQEKEKLLLHKKENSLLSAVRQITGLSVNTVEQLGKAYLTSLKTLDIDRTRHARAESARPTVGLA